MLAYAGSLAEARLDNEFWSKATAFFALRQLESEKFELMRQDKSELQYQSHGKTSQSFTHLDTTLGRKPTRLGVKVTTHVRRLCKDLDQQIYAIWED